jgi:hypothetical protein
VTLRFNGRNGRVLWQGRPATNGRITGTFAVPQAAPGYYVIVATQTGPDGRPAGGTPGRAPLKIKGASASSRRSSGTAPWIAPGPGGPGASGSGPDGLPAAPLLVGRTTLMLGLAGGGVALVRRRPLDAPRPLS